MNGWRSVQLGDVADLCLGKMLDAKKNKGEPYPYVSNPDVRWFDVDTSRLKTMRFESRELDRFGLCAGDVLVCEGGEAGRAAIWDGRRSDVKFQKAIHRVRPRPELVNRFLVHKLYSDYHAGRLEDYYTGATIQHLTGQDLATYEIPLPPVDEQKRIVAILDRAAALRAARQAALALLDDVARAMFSEEFGDALVNPKGLRTAVLESLCVRITDGTHQPPTWAERGHPFLFVSNVTTGELTFDTEKFISDETHAELTRRCPIEIGDVLYSTVGSYGVPAIVRTRRKFAFQRHLAHIKPNPALVDSEFLRAMLSAASVKSQADRVARGMAQKTVNLADIRKFVVLCPPLRAQQLFASRIAAIDKLKSVYRSSLAQMDALFASLQHRAFRGEL